MWILQQFIMNIFFRMISLALSDSGSLNSSTHIQILCTHNKICFWWFWRPNNGLDGKQSQYRGNNHNIGNNHNRGNNHNSSDNKNINNWRFDFTNICGLKSNLQSVFAYLQLNRPEMVFPLQNSGMIFRTTYFILLVIHKEERVFILEIMWCVRVNTVLKKASTFIFIWLKWKIS